VFKTKRFNIRYDPVIQKHGLTEKNNELKSCIWRDKMQYKKQFYRMFQERFFKLPAFLFLAHFGLLCEICTIKTENNLWTFQFFI